MDRTPLSRQYGRNTSAFLTLLLALAVSLAMVVSAQAQFKLVKISHDIFQNQASQHKTEVEPDTYAWGNTMVAAFQVARVYGGGGADLGFATSTDDGNTWTKGYLPGLTDNYKRGSFSAASDASVVYNAKYGVWLISSLPLTATAADVGVSRSKDGIHWEKPILVDSSGGDDKNWITCDNNSGSPYYGNCYTEWDSGTVLMSTSTDGGKTWGPPKTSADQAYGSGAEPLVQPNGKVVVPFLGNAMETFSSTDGGKSWGKSSLIANAPAYWGNSDLRSVGLAFPSTGIDGSGKIYVVWPDCSFRKGCYTNDLVLSTSTDGDTWTTPTRIPIDSKTSKVDHFIAGLGVNLATSGNTAQLTSTYYYYPDASCSTNCRLYVGFTTSQDGGKTWTRGKKLAGPMELTWLPNTFSGVMVADYLSTSYVNGNPYGVFMVAKAPVNGVFNEAAYTTSTPLVVPANEPRFSSAGEKRYPNAKSDRPNFKFRDWEREEEGPPANGAARK